jgi:hypothetical protein
MSIDYRYLTAVERLVAGRRPIRRRWMFVVATLAVAIIPHLFR